MKSLIMLCAVVAAVLARPDDGETYDPVYDNFNAQELVDSVSQLTNFANCFLDQGPCTPETSDFKRIFFESLRTNCRKCTPKQRQLLRITIGGFQEKVPDLWKQLVEKINPNGEYQEAFNAFLASD